MIQLKKAQVKIVSVLIALVFVGSVVALALTQSGTGVASAASSSNVGVVDYRQFTTLKIYTDAEAEMQKAALKQERAAKHAEHIEQAKILAGDVAMKAKDSIAKVVARKSKKKESEKENSYEQE